MQGEQTGVPRRRKMMPCKQPDNQHHKGLDLQMGIKCIPSTVGDIWYSALSECAGFKQLVRCTSLASTGVHGIFVYQHNGKNAF